MDKPLAQHSIRKTTEPKEYYEAKAKYGHDQMIRLGQVQILREKLSMCSLREGPNRYENCKYLVEQVAAAQKAYRRGYVEDFRKPKFEE